MDTISPVGLTSLVRAPRSVVPACEPLIPLFAIIPIAALVSSKEIPIALATGAIYFMASPVSDTAALVRFAFSAKTSATWAVSLAFRPKPRRVLAAISVLVAKSSPDAAAKFISPGTALIISLVLKPAAARFVMASAASEALNFVLAPNSFAVSSNFFNSSPVAPEIAATPDIPSSKEAPTPMA